MYKYKIIKGVIYICVLSQLIAKKKVISCSLITFYILTRVLYFCKTLRLIRFSNFII